MRTEFGIHLRLESYGYIEGKHSQSNYQSPNQILWQGRLDSGFSGVRDCVSKTLRNEGVLAFWRGNFASVIRYFPQQALNFAFKDEIKKVFKVSKNASNQEKLAKNVLSGKSLKYFKGTTWFKRHM